MIKPVLMALIKALEFIEKKLSKKKYKTLMSTVYYELLKKDPDLNSVKAKLYAAEATGVEPLPEMFRAKQMLSSVEKPTRGPTKGGYITKKKVAIKKAVEKTEPKKNIAKNKAPAKKKVAKKKVVKKKK
jgi:hypothetical protein